ncbi:MAG: hypothetical protein PHX82_05080 [Paracoccaceae bacterium]|nr:hypothetical protein [Paracoccaceae bacterium]
MVRLFNGGDMRIEVSSGDGDVYLVAVQDFVVAQDIVDTVRDAAPGAVIVTVPDCAAAAAAVAGHSRLVLAFVEAGPGRVAQLQLDREVVGRGGRLVLLGDAAEEAWDSGAATGRVWPVLIRPFSSPAVMALLKAARA